MGDEKETICIDFFGEPMKVPKPIGGCNSCKYGSDSVKIDDHYEQIYRNGKKCDRDCSVANGMKSFVSMVKK